MESTPSLLSSLQSHGFPVAYASTRQEFPDPSIMVPRSPGFQIPLKSFGLIGKRVLKILSSSIWLKENLRMSLLFAFYLMFTSTNLTADIYGASTVHQVLAWLYHSRKKEITAQESLTIK